MSYYLTDESAFTETAEAIRGKLSSQASIEWKSNGFADAVNDIPTDFGVFMWGIGYTSAASQPLGNDRTTEQYVVKVDNTTFIHSPSGLPDTGVLTNNANGIFQCLKTGDYDITYRGRGSYTSGGTSRPQFWSIARATLVSSHGGYIGYNYSPLTSGTETATGSFNNTGGSYSLTTTLTENYYYAVLASANNVRFDGCLTIAPASSVSAI